MATFETQIESLTKLDVGTMGAQDMVTQWLKDGVREIINRIITLSPADVVKFTTTSNTSINNYLDVNGRVLTVLRGHDSETVLRRAEIVDPGRRYDVTDIDSIFYRSKYNPGYYILDGKINIAPSPDDSNQIYVSQIKYDDELTYASSTVSNFPYEYEHLVPLYGAIKLLFRQFSIVEEEMGIMTLPLPPTAPTMSENTTDISALTAPTFEPPIITPLDWADTDRWIKEEEDTEMLSARVGEIEVKIREFSAKLQVQQGEFEEANTKFQADIQVAIENTRSKNEKEARDLQLFSQEALKYQQEVAKEIQRYQSEVVGKSTKKYEWLAARYASLLNDYTSAFSLMGDVASRSKQPQQQERNE